ncbi:AbfB domain-containing protein [Dactylosporangium darangshiense]|uniref:AbfB domain-containing protein n=1 Tax=Dactylosporangium darangshiense TaxID=579108 RepID=UPI00363BEFCB
MELAGQRRQVGQAVGWLDSDDRVLWSLWWLEVSEELTRPELAAALGVGVAHAGVRIQRMRGRLEQARALVAALDARPRCPWLETIVAEWNGVPGPLWRKRIARHVRSCVACTRAMEGAVDTERLLNGFALLAVPAALTGTLATGGKFSSIAPGAGGTSFVANAVTSGAAKAGWLAGVPVAKLAAGTLVIGVAATMVAWPRHERPQPTGAPTSVASPPASPSTESSAPSLRPGRLSLEFAAEPGRFLGTDGQVGILATGDTALARQRATFEAVPGLADADCYSLRTSDGQYLRHTSWRLRLSRDEGTQLFRGDATFCPLGPGNGEVLLEASNYRGYFIHREGDELWVRPADGTAQFRADSTFRVRPALA